MNDISELCKKIPLEIRLRVLNEMLFMGLISELGYREPIAWKPSEDCILTKLLMAANEATRLQLETIKEWEIDGNPV